ncbi:PA-phosphatase [Mycobacterium sp. IS-1742]|uniref:PA-phosphatase n=1 Tax=Mycobacterium sp. IS-1742 TaxID=1772285 RepID=UPI0007403B8B|nr:PA-phosphatase [Mycobacterium sp. IS-1742]KUI29894.1 PA-phosphatase [Mycobacterium sp. IS-1742]
MRTALQWWPAVAVTGLFALGWLVGKGSTPFDSRLLAVDAPDRLLTFVEAPVQVAVLGAAVAYALWRRRWRLAVLAALCPPVAVVSAQLLKRVFGRTRDGELAYPSGHITALVVVAGMVVLVAGGRLWAVVAAAVAVVVGMVLVGMSFHYFTDTVGALLLGSAYVAAAARLVTRTPLRVT